MKYTFCVDRAPSCRNDRSNEITWEELTGFLKTLQQAHTQYYEVRTNKMMTAMAPTALLGMILPGAPTAAVLR